MDHTCSKETRKARLQAIRSGASHLLSSSQRSCCKLECTEYFLNCRVHKAFRDVNSLGVRQRAVKKSLDDALSESLGRQGAATVKNLDGYCELRMVGETGLEPVTPCL